MSESCTDNRFEVIEKAKEDILKATNIETSKDEMKVLDNFLFRCWQMGWLEKSGKRRMTNADRIRRMTNEELAVFLNNVASECEKITVCDEDCVNCANDNETCELLVLSWLENEVI